MHRGRWHYDYHVFYRMFLILQTEINAAAPTETIRDASYVATATTNLHHITSHHITSHHITSHHITSHHITSHHTTPHHTTPHHITPRHTTPYHTTPHTSSITLSSHFFYTLPLRGITIPTGPAFKFNAASRPWPSIPRTSPDRRWVVLSLRTYTVCTPTSWLVIQDGIQREEEYIGKYVSCIWIHLYVLTYIHTYIHTYVPT